jgi:hypothetical protein
VETGKGIRPSARPAAPSFALNASTMYKVLLDGIEVCLSELTQRPYRAIPCQVVLPVTKGNRNQALADFKRLYDDGQCQGLRVSGIADLGFLEEFPDLLYLEIVEQKNVNTRPLDFLRNLRGLRLDSPGAGIDFARFEELEVFQGDWHSDNRNLDRARELRRIEAWQFKPRSGDLRDLANIPRLEILQLTQTNITSLAGVETLQDLRYLDVAYASKLESLAALTSTPPLEIRELHLSNAKKISGYKHIASLKHLRRLQLSTCAPMPDLRWTEEMDRLDMFSFVETNVQDGDLSPLLSLPAL